MLLSDGEILHHVMSGKIGVEPFDDRLVQPASLDVRLGVGMKALKSSASARRIGEPIKPWEGLPVGVEYVEYEAENDGDLMLLFPGDFVLGHTLETVSLPANMAAKLEGKSSLGRLGLMVHSTAGFVDPGFSGQVTLELSNVGQVPVALRPGMAVGQLAFMRLGRSAVRPYGSPGLGSHYQGQFGATVSRGHEQGS